MTTYINDSAKISLMLQTMSLPQMGAFVRLQNHYILTGPIEANLTNIYRLCQAVNNGSRKAVNEIIAKFFRLSECGGFYLSDEFQSQREESERFVESKRRAGKVSSEVRKLKRVSREIETHSSNLNNHQKNNDSPSTLVQPLISLLEDKKEEGKPSSNSYLLKDARDEEKNAGTDPPVELQKCNTVAKIQQIVTECFPNILSGGIVIEEWIKQGADPDLDIIPTIRDVAKKKGPGLRSITYLTPCVAQSKQTRELTQKTFGETAHAKTFERPETPNPTNHRRPTATELQRRLREQYGPNLDGNREHLHEPLDVTGSGAFGEIGEFAP